MEIPFLMRGFLVSLEDVPLLVVRFQFNPYEMTDDKVVSYSDAKGGLRNAPGKMYQGGGDRTIEFTLNLHGFEQGMDPTNPTPLENGVAPELAKLRSFLYPRKTPWDSVAGMVGGTKGKRLVAPPRCLFGFGSKMLECIVGGLEVKEEQFNSMLACVRATVTVTLVVVEEPGNAFYEADNVRRDLLASKASLTTLFSL